MHQSCATFKIWKTLHDVTIQNIDIVLPSLVKFSNNLKGSILQNWFWIFSKLSEQKLYSGLKEFTVIYRIYCDMYILWHVYSSPKFIIGKIEISDFLATELYVFLPTYRQICNFKNYYFVWSELRKIINLNLEKLN